MSFSVSFSAVALEESYTPQLSDSSYTPQSPDFSGLRQLQLISVCRSIFPASSTFTAGDPGGINVCGDNACCSKSVCVGTTAAGILAVSTQCDEEGGTPLDLDDDGTNEGCDFSPWAWGALAIAYGGAGSNRAATVGNRKRAVQSSDRNSHTLVTHSPQSLAKYLVFRLWENVTW